MEIVINTKQCPCRTLNDECYISNDDCYEDDICSTCPLIRNGGVKLPEHHGKLKDAEKLANDINALKDNWNRWGNEYESGRYESYDYAVDTIEDAPTIIEGSESK